MGRKIQEPQLDFFQSLFAFDFITFYSVSFLSESSYFGGRELNQYAEI